jgi:iduronate 2-sulfatase
MRLPTALALLACLSAFAAETRKNVLLLVSDDCGTRMGTYGGPALTPNIDALAREGVRFDRAYCQYALCNPSRTSFLTGLRPDTTGVYDNAKEFRKVIPDIVTMPQMFKNNGYTVGRIGKLYHYGVPKEIGTNGLDDPQSWEQVWNPRGRDCDDEDKIFSIGVGAGSSADKAKGKTGQILVGSGNYGGTLSWLAAEGTDAEQTDGKIAAQAISFLQEKRAKPFFLAVGFFRPHTPYVAPRPYFNAYPEAEMRVVSGVKEDQADLPPAALASYKREQDQLTDPLRRQALQAYYASISFMDAQVGRVLSALDRLGLADSTTLVFTSDHGYLTGEHGLWQKQSLFEPSARVPLLIVAPGVARPGSVVRTPVSQVDLYPTLCDLAGVTPPANLQGESLVPLLKDPAAPSRGWALTQVARGGRPAGAAAATAAKAEPAPGKVKGGARAAKKAVSGGEPGERFFGYSLRTARWRYTEWGDAGKHGAELYDHDRDPGELTNLADRPEHAATRRELAAKLASAVRASYPASGEAPAVREGLWMPLLVP